MIKLYWWNIEKNFGDELSPMLCNRLSGQQITYAKHFKSCDLIAIGSLLQHVNVDDYDGAIWGSGFIASKTPVRTFRKSNICAVRGELTKKLLNCKKDIPLGDPGLLSDMFSVSQEKKYKFGIIPHYVDANLPIFKNLSTLDSDLVLIDIMSGPKNVISKISECSYILSTCLHGLIAADALNIPNCWIKVSDNITGGEFKFIDYYSAFGLYNEKPIIVKDRINLDSILKKLDDYKRPNIEEIKYGLVDSFPYMKDKESFWAKKRKLKNDFLKFSNWQYQKFNNFIKGNDN